MISSSDSSSNSGSAEEDNEVSNDNKTIASEQLSKIEQNRKKALELKASKRPLSHEPGANVRIVPTKVAKTVGPPRIIDSGGGFLIEEDLCQSSSSQVKIVHEPGALLEDDGRICEDCGKPFMESYLMNKFDKSVCDTCKEANETKSYKLITKTDAKMKYQLKDVDLDKREPILKFIVKKNPRHDKWGEMKLYLESQVSARAIEVHGSTDQIEKEKNKKLEKREKIQQKKFEKNIKALRMSIQSSQPSKIHSGHKHEFGPDVYNSVKDEYTKTCKTCGHSVTFEKM